MAYAQYPGYEIDRFEDEGGQCYIRLIFKSSEEEVDNEASKLRESESSQESTEMEQHNG